MRSQSGPCPLGDAFNGGSLYIANRTNIPKYYSLNSNVIVTYGYDCENGVDESVKTMLVFHPTKE